MSVLVSVWSICVSVSSSCSPDEIRYVNFTFFFYYFVPLFCFSFLVKLWNIFVIKRIKVNLSVKPTMTTHSSLFVAVAWCTFCVAQSFNVDSFICLLIALIESGKCMSSDPMMRCMDQHWRRISRKFYFYFYRCGVFKFFLCFSFFHLLFINCFKSNSLQPSSLHSQMARELYVVALVHFIQFYFLIFSF